MMLPIEKEPLTMAAQKVRLVAPAMFAAVHWKRYFSRCVVSTRGVWAHYTYVVKDG